MTPDRDFDIAVAEPEGIARLTTDLKKASRLLGQAEARYLVDYYYTIQDDRIRSAAQIRSALPGEPNAVLEWAFDNLNIFERQLRNALGQFAKEYRVGRWLLSLTGIGPVISSGLLAHLDVRKTKTASGFQRFAGIDPTLKWNKGEKRPWNAQLKTLVAFKAGESFCKVQNNKNDFYGHLFAKRKELEWQNNLQGLLQSEAARALSEKKFDKKTVAYLFYSGQLCPADVREMLKSGGVPQTVKASANGHGVPMLPPAHIHARARRWVTRLFLSHVFDVMCWDYYGHGAPIPYVFAKSEWHTDFIPPPNWPGEFKGRPLKDLLDR